MEFKTVDSLIAEISASNFYKDNPHLIDKVSIYRWVHLALKKFGMNLMQKKSKVIEVTNYQAELGQDFGKLSLAVFCEKNKCVVNGDVDRLLGTYFYTDKIEQTYFVNNIQVCGDNCAALKEENTITENFFIHDECDVTLCYKNPVYVKLGRDVLKDGCTTDCINRTTQGSPYEINIKGQTLYANFKSGDLYFEYYSLPVDEEGIPLIPATENGRLEEYLEYLIKRKILEDAALSKDGGDIFNMFQWTAEQERELFGQAQRDVSPMSLKSFWQVISDNRLKLKKFEINLGKRSYARYPSIWRY